MALSKDVQDALMALERLQERHKVLTPEQAKAAARLLAGEDIEFPLRRSGPAAPHDDADAPEKGSNGAQAAGE